MKRTVAWISRATLIALALVTTNYTANAQQAKQASSPTASEKQAGNNFHSSFASGEFAFNGRGVVQGAPFSAVGITETTQILSDGSRINRRRVTSLFRDSLGRTRSEWGNETGKASTSAVPIIYDAVTGAAYFVNTRHGNALQLSPPVKDNSLRQVKIVTPQSPPDDITRLAGERVEPLGTQIIEGLKAEGVRVTTTIQAVGVGSNRSDKVVYERWYSQELRRNILIKCTDPRFGEAVYRLTNIDRNEPAQELFTIPAGYQIQPFPAHRPERTLKSGYVK
ncbi:MAG TPA: hypothetical protein VF791_05440 [Pyrinomonadaceae bacterium]